MRYRDTVTFWYEAGKGDRPLGDAVGSDYVHLPEVSRVAVSHVEVGADDPMRRWQGKPPEEVVALLEERLARAHSDINRLRRELAWAGDQN